MYGKPLRKSAEPAIDRLKPSPFKHIKKRVTFVTLFLIVDGVTILEPNDNEILSQIMQSDNIYHRIVCVMKQSTQEYYNMRIILGLETI